jgi:hypothetical protein
MKPSGIPVKTSSYPTPALKATSRETIPRTKVRWIPHHTGKGPDTNLIPGKTETHGTVIFPATHLRDRLTRNKPAPDTDGKPYYEVRLRIEIKVIDRHIQFAAYWPHYDVNAPAIQGVHEILDLTRLFVPTSE